MKKILVLFFLAWKIMPAYSQSGGVPAGGMATGPGGTVSYSVGQIDYITASGPGGTISEGVQQPFEITTLSAKENSAIRLTADVFPNPASEYVMLNVDELRPGLHYTVTDLNGKLLAEKRITEKQSRIPLGRYANSACLVKIFDTTSEIKSFKIIKNN